MATSLAEKYAQLADTTPVLQDPEDDVYYETRARVTDKCDEDDSDLYFSSSQLRQRNAKSLADEDSRYSGKKVSRKSLQDEVEGNLSASDMEVSDEEDSSEDEEEDIASFQALLNKKEKHLRAEDGIQGGDDDEEDDSGEDDLSHEEVSKGTDDSEDSNEDDDDDDDDDDDNELPLVPEKDMIQKFSQINIDQEIEKGKAVQAQLSLWDMLLECRIKMQKMLSLSNCLPQLETWDTFLQQGGEEYHQIMVKNKNVVKKLLLKLILIQEKLLLRNPETSHVVEGHQKKAVEESHSDEEIPSDTEEEEEVDSEGKEQSASSNTSRRKRKLLEKDIPGLLEKRYKCFRDYRNTTIQKWNDKSRLASGKVSQKSFAAFEQSAVKQIEQILNDRDRLRKRTQLKRSTYRVLGKPDNQKEVPQESAGDLNPEDLPKKNDHLKDYDQEIFDDDDFYHQLLRELIERKTADVKDPIAISRQWLEIQKLRSKIKKKVDTKASKGRKIRFDVHPKLVNFMAPVPNHEMTDEAKNELFRSLFGNQGIQTS